MTANQRNAVFFQHIANPMKTLVALTVCPLGNEKPVAEGRAAAIGTIRGSRTHGRKAQIEVFKNCVNTSAMFRARLQNTPVFRSMAQ
ncbi:MAG: hypothetical protein BWX70_03297 [Verrucomicrobia bacterium ADurb.Bin070]|nr:MAG: hypothetical protein BWX70_03297 [Verrucomicrobia bacterium ADurb.Bin070]